ncbi:SDR family NAD(P)-dependent oxidoreductase [Saccharopolyspora sp. NPDC000995]
MSDWPDTARAQQQRPPGTTQAMQPLPRDEMRDYVGARHLYGKRALITGGDSGIGRAVAIAFAKEGADVAISYLDEVEDDDAEHTAELVREQGRSCYLHRGDVAGEQYCNDLIDNAVQQLGGLDVLVNHAGTQAAQDDLASISNDRATGRHRQRDLSDHSWSWLGDRQPGLLDGPGHA